MRRSPAVAALIAVVALAGCGGSDDDAPSTTTTTTAPAPSKPETIDHVPKLPGTWHKHVNERGGFALGLPRGWKPRDVGAGTLVRSYDHLVAISITSDRRPDALAEPLDEFTSATASSLRGFRGELKTKAVRSYDHHYYAAEVRARGTAKGGVDQRLSVIVLRRDGTAQLTAVIAANAKHSADESLHLAKRIVATLRTRPPAGKSHRGAG